MVLRRHVLIFHQAALGDFIVTWPIALALGRMFAQSRISYITAGSKGALASRVLGVEAVEIETDWHALYREEPSLSDRNLRLLEGAHTIVSFVAQPGDLWTKNINALASNANLIHLKTQPVADAPILDALLPESLQNHITAYLLQQLDAWPVIQAGVRQMVRSVMDRGVPVRRNAGKGVAIHPGAGSPAKRWPIERFEALITAMCDENIPVRLLLGEAEAGDWTQERLAKLPSQVQVHRPNTLLQLLDGLTDCAAFLGNDSGPAHLAGIVGIPTIALFGKPSARWKPLGPTVRVIEADGMDAISLHEVMTALRPMLQSVQSQQRTAVDDD